MQFMRSADDAQCRGQFKILYRCRDWRGDWHLHVKAASYPPSEVGINVDEIRKHAPANLSDRNFRQFKHKRRGEMGLLGRIKRTEEESCLAVMIGKAFCPNTKLVPLLGGWKRFKAGR